MNAKQRESLVLAIAENLHEAAQVVWQQRHFQRELGYTDSMVIMVFNYDSLSSVVYREAGFIGSNIIEVSLDKLVPNLDEADDFATVDDAHLESIWTEVCSKYRVEVDFPDSARDALEMAKNSVHEDVVTALLNPDVTLDAFAAFELEQMLQRDWMNDRLAKVLEKELDSRGKESA